MPSFKLPPDPSTAKSYELWKDAAVWQELTDVPVEKQGRALQYACRVNVSIHEAVMAVPDAQVKCAEGFDNVIKAINKVFKV